MHPPADCDFILTLPQRHVRAADTLFDRKIGDDMPKLLFTLPLIAALGIGSSVFAQDDTTTTAEDTATTTEQAQPAEAAAEAEGTAAGTEEQLDIGEEVAEDPTYIKETYGDWQLKCFRTETGENPCQMFQLLREETGNPIAEFSIFRLPEGSEAVAGATIVVPLGTMLTQELKIAVDGGKAKSYAYRFCSLVGCYAQVGLTKEDIEAFKRGVSAILTIVPAQAPDKKVEIKGSLSGFTSAFDNTTVLDK